MSRYVPPVLPAHGCYCSSLDHRCDFCNGYRALIRFESTEARDLAASVLILRGFERGHDFCYMTLQGPVIEASIPRTIAEVIAVLSAPLATVVNDGDDYTVMVAGRAFVSRESFTIAERIATEINSGAPDITRHRGGNQWQRRRKSLSSEHRFNSPRPSSRSSRWPGRTWRRAKRSARRSSGIRK